MLRHVTLNKANRLKDRSITLNFVTALEQDSEEFMEIDKSIGQHGDLYFKEDGTLTQKEIEEIDKTDIEVVGKTKSQRLRAVIAVYAKQQGLDVNEYYSKTMETLIQEVKDNLE